MDIRMLAYESVYEWPSPALAHSSATRRHGVSRSVALIIMCLALPLAFAALACSPVPTSGGSGSGIKAIQVVPKAVTTIPAAIVGFGANIVDANGNVSPATGATWSSSNTGILQVANG